jgi:2-dehydro-3-deoxy-D-pentonate aldolase
MKLPLKGVIPPVVTPLTDNNNLDIKGLENLIEYLIAGGVNGLFMLGTAGEATSLGYNLRKQLLKRTSEITGKRVPVLAGITDTSLEGSLEIADFATNLGIDGLVLAPPYYLPISQEEMWYYLENLVPKLHLPFLMYNIPSCTKLHMSVKTIRIAQELGAVGIKDSSGDISYLNALIHEFRSTPEFSILTGFELLMPDIVMQGGHGAVSGTANIFPGLIVDLYNASCERDIEKVVAIKELLMRIKKTIYLDRNDLQTIIRSLKCSLSVLNLCNGFVASPLQEYRKEEKILIEKYIAELKDYAR